MRHIGKPTRWDSYIEVNKGVQKTHIFIGKFASRDDVGAACLIQYHSPFGYRVFPKPFEAVIQILDYRAILPCFKRLIDQRHFFSGQEVTMSKINDFVYVHV